VPPKVVIKLSVDKWHQPRTLQRLSISASAETDLCFVGVFHTLNAQASETGEYPAIHDELKMIVSALG
jgi:hypothetical protein